MVTSFALVSLIVLLQIIPGVEGQVNFHRYRIQEESGNDKKNDAKLNKIDTREMAVSLILYDM
jgi:hypothetical protein